MLRFPPAGLPLPPGVRRLAAVCTLAVTLAAGTLAAGTLAACDGGTTPDAPVATDLAGRFAARGRYAPLAAALELAGIDLGAGPVTVLAPTETALRYLGSDFSPVLFAPAQREALARVLRHHIVARRLAPEDFADGATFTSLAGTTLTVRRIGPVVTVNGVTVDVTDAVEGTNGVAYPAADVLLDVLTGAERVRLSPLLSALAAGFRSTGVEAEAGALPAVTLLAPITDGFTALGPGPLATSLSLLTAFENTDVYRRILRAQILPGDVDLGARVGQTVTALSGDRLPVARDADQVLTVAGVRVLQAERTRDGRVYVLAEPVLSTLTVSERLRVRADLTRFRDDLAPLAAQAAALADRAREVTVFAPTNAAYATRGVGVDAALLSQPALRARATAVHVVYGRYALADLTDGLRLTATDGTVLTVVRTDASVRVGNLLVSVPSVQANGLLYTAGLFVLPDVDLLDTVLLSGFAAYAQAVRATGIEAEFRASVRTAFVVPDRLGPTLTSQTAANQRAILRRTASTEFIPDIGTGAYPRTIATLGGPRTLVAFECPRIAPPPTGGDLGCSPIGFDAPGGTEPRPQVYPGGTTQSGTAAFYPLRSVDTPG